MPHFPRVVIDTNIWISLFLAQGGTVLHAVEWVWENAEIIASEATLLELRETLQRSKFKKRGTATIRRRFVEEIERKTVIVPVSAIIADCPDPRDNKFLELAKCGEAAYIVTGDQHLLSLDPWDGVRIVRPAEFLKLTAK